ncbi:MAG: NblA/ycf18 family protein [Pleurocapsa sp.]
MSDSMQLSLEQKFNIRSFETQVQSMSHEQAQEFLVKLYEQMILKDNMYQHFIRHQWGIDSPPTI